MTGRLLRALAALVLLAGVALVRPTPAAAAWASPGAPSLTSRSTTAVALTWAPVWGAPRYRVKYSASRSWSNPKYLTVSENRAELTGLRTGTRYWVKVRVTTTAGNELSGYGPATEVSTRGSGSRYTQLTPRGFTLHARDGDSLTLTWKPRAGIATYQLQYSRSADMSNARFASTRGSSLRLGDLTEGSGYWVKLRGKNASGVGITTFSAALGVRTTTGERFAPLRAASYNVLCANCAPSYPWSTRRAKLVAAIKAQDLDVLGVQEASQGLTTAADGTRKAQFDDLLDLLGDDYAMVNRFRYNCVKSTSPNYCEPQDRGASGDVRIIYRKAEVELLRDGSTEFAEQDPNDTKRFVAWAELRQRATGKRFFVVNTHLDPNDDKSGSSYYYEIRRAQARELVSVTAKENRSDLPVVILGDFKSSKYAVPSNAPYDVIVGAGYVDPLGNTYRSTVPSRAATVERRVDTEYNTKNNLASQAPRSAYINGSVIDYLYTSAGVRVAEWQTVVDVTSSGAFVEKPPSDHNMVRATLYLP